MSLSQIRPPCNGRQCGLCRGRPLRAGRRTPPSGRRGCWMAFPGAGDGQTRPCSLAGAARNRLGFASVQIHLFRPTKTVASRPDPGGAPVAYCPPPSGERHAQGTGGSRRHGARNRNRQQQPGNESARPRAPGERASPASTRRSPPASSPSWRKAARLGCSLGARRTHRPGSPCPRMP